MTRRARFRISGHTQHILQSGHSGQAVFTCRADYLHYLNDELTSPRQRKGKVQGRDFAAGRREGSRRSARATDQREPECPAISRSVGGKMR
jgi:hypothetical protein